jgi:glycosyltransferase involved in cell wall biosynthesis
MDYSIIIPAYNEEDLLPLTLESALAAKKALSAKFAGQIIVVDNNSSDRTAEIAKSHGAKVVFEKENCIARARNRGAEAAEGRLLIFLDADTTASPELIGAALAAMSDGGVCAGGCFVGFEDGHVDRAAKVLAWIWNHIIIRIYPVAAGSFLFCLKEAWLGTGGFDERYYASEELHFSKALRRWGGTRGLCFKVLPLHVQSSSRKFKTYSKRQMISKILPLMLCPWRLRSRNSCSIWYVRK